MAESLAEKLKRIAREKREAQEKLAAAAVAVEVEVANGQPEKEEVNDGKASMSGVQGELQETVQQINDDRLSEDGDRQAAEDTISVEASGGISSINFIGCDGSETELTIQPTPSSHPLAMQFAELEAALLTADPTFKTTLRDVHRHLGKDPELVTLMTEEEVEMIVKGLVVFANAEVVEPAKAKAVKTAAKALKNISADDL